MNNKKVVLITGNLGYIGVELSKYLKKKYKNIYIIGYDVGFYRNDIFDKKNFKKFVDYQIFSDLREFKYKILGKFKIDTIFHLAAISNDPIGSLFVRSTRQINTLSSKKLINWAKNHQVKKFIFASSCSVYGFSNKICTENSKARPLTEYAKSKLEIEKYLKKNCSSKFKSIALRFSTACGSSHMLRLDLVLNDFVASALTLNKITLLSDGNSLRPLIDVSDMVKAFYWAGVYNSNKFLCVNVGNKKMNYKIIQLANLVKKYLPKANIQVNTNNKDQRSYKVSFNKYKSICPYYSSMKDAAFSIRKLISTIRINKFKNKNFRSGNFMRLISLKNQIKNKKLSNNLKVLDRNKYYKY